MKIAVIALGKIGLPLAVQYASMGHEVIGADVDPRVVEMVNRGLEPFPGEPGLADKLASVVGKGRLLATTDAAAASARAEAIVVVVPLYVNERDEPDFTWMDAATQEVGRGLRSGSLVAFETTVPIGTTRGRCKPLLETTSGLVEGQDFHVVYSPERVLTGRIFADLQKYPKLVGGLSSAGAKRATDFYEDVLEFVERPDLARGNGVWDLGSAEAAEMAKLAETTYRDVNIGLANQFATYAAANGIDVWEVIEASNSQPFSHIHRPGIAVGGHCIPVYPRLYLWNHPDATIVRAAREANAAMPAYAVALARELYGNLTAARVTVLGASYRGGVKEVAFSGVFPIVEALKAEHAIVTVHDPMYSNAELRDLGLEPNNMGSVADIIIVQADHDEYRTLSSDHFPGIKLAIDGRNILQPINFPRIRIAVVGKSTEDL